MHTGVKAAFFLLLFYTTMAEARGADEATDGEVITTNDLVTIRDITTMATSPNGRHLAYRIVQADSDGNGYDVSWYIVPTISSAEPMLVAGGLEAELATNSGGTENGQLHAGEVIWSPDGEWVVYTAKNDGEVQLWRSRHDRYGMEQLTHNAADVEGPRFSSDGSRLFFAVGRDREAIRELNTANARRGYLEQEPPIYDVAMGGPRLPPCRDSQERVAQQINNALSCQLTIWALDFETNIERLATTTEIEDYYAETDTSLAARVRRGRLRGENRRMETASPNGQHTAWFENEDPEIYQGFSPPLRIAMSEGDDVIRCPVASCVSNDPEGIWWRADGGEIIFLVLNGHNETLSSLYGWTPGGTDVRTILRTDDRFYDCGLNGDRLICGHESWTTPRRIVSVDLANGEITAIADPNPEFQDFRFTRIEKILDTDAYGNEAHAHLVYPSGYQEGQRYPLVIVQYRSRGFLRGGTGDEYPIHVLAQNGFAVLSFGTPDGDYEEMEGDRLANQTAYLGYLINERGPTTAIERMVDDLANRGIIDPSRVGITGLSQGAITLESALLARNYAAASSTYSLSPSPVFERPMSSFWGQAMNGVFGGTPYSPSGFENRAAVGLNWNAHRINTPYLIQVADREYRYPVQNYAALMDAGKPVEMHIFPDEYHVKWQPAHRLTVYNRNIDWFNFWLREVEDPDPAKAEQYERWRALRELHQANLAELADEKAMAAAEAERQAELAAIIETVSELASDVQSEAPGSEPSLAEID